MTDDPLNPQDNGRSSIAERAEAGVEPDAAELFPRGTVAGDSKAPSQLIRKGLPVAITAALSRAEVPLVGGLVDPDKAGRVLVSFAFAKQEEVPTERDETGRVIGWKIRQHLTASHVKPAGDEAALIRSEFEALLTLDPRRAGALLDELQAIAAAELEPAAA